MISLLKKVYRKPTKYFIDESHKFDWHKKEREEAKKQQQAIINQFRERVSNETS